MDAISKKEIFVWIAETSGIDPERLSEETPIFTTGLLDSFTLVSLIQFIESKTGSPIPLSQVNMRNFDRIKDIWLFISKQQSGCQRATE